MPGEKRRWRAILTILVDFSEPMGWEVVNLKEYLEDLLSHKVDLLPKGGITNRPRVVPGHDS